MQKFELHQIGDTAEDLEQLGTKEKFWFIHPPGAVEKWLFKYSKGKTGEHWSEKVAEQISELLGIPHVEYQLAERNGRFGVITKNVVPKKCSMVMGNEVLNAFDPANYPAPQMPGEPLLHVQQHTIERVSRCLQHLNVQPPDSTGLLGDLNAFDIFCGYLMLDALIGNQDRHHENWAILIYDETGRRTLCPSYDHAASLGRELLDDERNIRLTTKDKNRQVAAFVRRARSAFFRLETDIKPLPTLDAFLLAVADRPKTKAHWMAALAGCTDKAVEDVFQRNTGSGYF